MHNLIAMSAYGGTLVNLMVSPTQAEVLKRASVGFPSIDLDHRQICDLELLLK